MTTLTFPAVIVRCFELQRVLMARYQPIEQFPTPPIALHPPNEQRVLKDFAWRLTEELGESYDAYMEHRDDDTLDELIDAFHFFFELCIFAGVTPAQCLTICDKLPPDVDKPASDFYWEIVFQLSQAMHLLKNRPWKRSVAPTDEARFRHRLTVIFDRLCRLWAQFSSHDELLRRFEAKHAVNAQRQAGGY
jgi:hypothetical protein